MKPFFITGLPRSRTKWFSEYFSGVPNTFCMHQGVNGVYSERSLLNKMGKIKSEYVGNSDCLMLLMRLQEYPTVIIDRDIEEVFNSLSERTDAILDAEMMRKYRFMETLKDKMPGLHIPFKDINANLESIHEYLVDIPYDSQYGRGMISKNVRVDVGETLLMSTMYRVVNPRLAMA